MHSRSGCDLGDDDLDAFCSHGVQRLGHAGAAGIDVTSSGDGQRAGTSLGRHGFPSWRPNKGMPNETFCRALRITSIASWICCWSAGAQLVEVVLDAADQTAQLVSGNFKLTTDGKF